MRLVKCYLWSVFTYGCETWTLKPSLEKNINALEMWVYRRMNRTSWKEMKTNEQVLKDLGIKKTTLLNTIKQRQISYYGHTRRHETLQKKILEGKIDGKRGRGRRRNCWTKNISDATGMKMNECCEAALDRERWRAMTSNLSKETEQR